MATKRNRRPSSWPGERRQPRALVEDDDGASQWAVAQIFERVGFEVACCDGPAAFRDHKCPMLKDGSCSLAAGADVIFNSLSLSMAENLELIGALRQHLPDTPLLVEVPRPRAEQLGDALDGCRLLAVPATASTIASHALAAIAEAS